MNKIALFAILSIALLCLASTPSYAWVYPQCTEDLKFERFGARVDQIVVKLYSKDTIMLDNMELGKFDMSDWGILKSYLDRWIVDPLNKTLKIIPLPPPRSERGYYLLDLNCYPYPTLPDGSPNPVYPNPTSVSSVRHAIAHCVNRAWLVANCCDGMADPMYTMMLPYMTDYVHPQITPGPPPGALVDLTHPFNTTEAARLLKEDNFLLNETEYAWRFWDGKPGYPKDGHYQPGEEVEVKFYGRSDHAWRNCIAMTVAGILQAAPVKLKVNLILAVSSVCSREVMANKNYNIYTGGWIFVGPEPDHLYDLYSINMYWHPGRPPNYEACNSSEYEYWAAQVKFAVDKAQAIAAAYKAQEVWATPCCIGGIPICVNKSPKMFARAYTGGNGGVLVSPDDGENKYRGLMWKGIVNEYGFGENSYWTKLNAHPAGYEMGDCSHMTLRYGFKQAYLSDFGVIYSSWYWDMEIIGLVYDTLMMRDPNTLTDLIPWLAKSLRVFDWVDPADGKTKSGVHITLKSGLKWSDGQPLTADDVVFTFMYLPQKLSARGLPEPWFSSYVWPTAQSVYQIDPCNIVVLYNAKSAWVKYWVGIAVPIIPKHIWKTIVDTGDPTQSIPGPDPNYIGSGPFKFVEYVEADHAKLVKNPLFFQWCPIDVDVEIDAPPEYKGKQKFPPCNDTVGSLLKFTIQTENIYWNQTEGSELWIDKYVYFSNETGEYLLPGYPHNIHLPGREAQLYNDTLVDLTNPICSIWKQWDGCPMQEEYFHVIDWEDNCNGVLDACDKLLMECTDPLKNGWYHVETFNPPHAGILTINMSLGYEIKEEIGLADLPPPYNTLTHWLKGDYDIRVAVHIKDPQNISVYTWTLSEFLADPQIPPHYEQVPNPWVCQWINRTFNFRVDLRQDATGDFYVGIDDIVYCAEHFGTYPSHTRWDAVYDVIMDYYIGIDDVVDIAGNFGKPIH